MSYREAIQFLYGLRLFGAKFGLENTFELAARCGNPHQRLRFIHVAGTNGKGSTCAMLESIYRASGLRVGLFTSPHLVSFRERIQVDRQPITELDVVRRVDRLRAMVESFGPARHPTFFEVVTLMALEHFVERACDLVIWETGLGGRLDSTNIVTPLASVITNIQLDHEKWLGSTLAQIAAEKAGIIKPCVPVITAASAPEAQTVIAETAARQDSALTQVTAADAGRPPLDAITLPLLGEHQKLNAALALAVVRQLQTCLPVADSAVRTGLEQVDWPGRLQRITSPGGRTILLDGAHNPAGAETLRDALLRYFPGRRPTVVLGIMQDKDWRAMCQILAPLAGRVLLAPVHSERTAAPEQLAEVCRATQGSLECRVCGSVTEALDAASHDDFVVIAGSLHLIGEAAEALGILPASPGERGLNEWNLTANTGATPMPTAAP